MLLSSAEEWPEPDAPAAADTPLPPAPDQNAWIANAAASLYRNMKDPMQANRCTSASRWRRL